jgi:hypothetical protein
VAAEKRCDGSLVTLGDELAQQFGIAHLDGRATTSERTW